MAQVPLMTLEEAQEILNQEIEDGITRALTPQVLAMLEARGHTEATARHYLRTYVANKLDRPF